MLESNHRGRRSPKDLVSLFGFFLALVFAFGVKLRARILPYDEGILLANGQFVRRGLRPYTDFYTNYGFASSYFSALLTSERMPVLAPRIAGLAVTVGIWVAVGYLSGRSTEKRFDLRFAVVASVPSLFLIETIAPSAWQIGMLFCLLSILALQSDIKFNWLLSGVLLTFVSWFRLDLWVFATVAYVVVFLCSSVNAVLGWPRIERQNDTARAAILGGFTVPLTWLFVLGPRGVSEAFFQVLVLQVRYVSKNRRLNIVDFLTPTSFKGLYGVLICVALVGSLVLFARYLRSFRQRTPEFVFDHRICVLALLSVLVLPQLVNRADSWHAALIVTPAIALTGRLVAKGIPSPGNGLALVLETGAVGILIAANALFLFGDRGTTDAKGKWFSTPREEASLMQLQQKISTYPAEYPIWVGCPNHRTVNINDMSWYRRSGRLPASKWTQFDPGIQDLAVRQREIIRNFEEWDSPILILQNGACPLAEYTSLGSPILDSYLSAHVKPIGVFGSFRLGLLTAK